MPWVNEERYKRCKKVYHDTDPGRYRVSSTQCVQHYESSIDSGTFDTEVDLRLDRTNNARLNGWRVNTNGWHFAYQGFAATQNQSPIGTVGYGGRKGQNFLTLRPYRIGFLRWPTRTFQPIGGAPVFTTPTRVNNTKTFGIDDADPSVWTINAGFTSTVSNIWTLGAGSVDWAIKTGGSWLKQDFILDQAARDFATAQFNNGPAIDNWFGIAYRVGFAGVPRGRLNGILRNLQNDDFTVGNGDSFSMEDAIGRKLGYFGPGEIHVPNRGGRIDIQKRFYFDGSAWWFFIGGRVNEINQNLMPGNLVIDPPIGEEDITQDSDDASQSGSGMNLSGAGNAIFTGGNGYYHSGWRFQSVPIGNGDTITSATLEPTRATAGVDFSGVTINLYGEDADNMGTFTTAANNLTGRGRTATPTALTGADWPSVGARGSWDVATPVADITTRGGWASNNALGFLAITTSSTGFLGWDDYSGGVADAADFNADVTAAAGTSPEFIINQRRFQGTRPRYENLLEH